MKVIFTVAKRIIEKGIMIGSSAEEIIVEDVGKMEFNEGIEKVTCYGNSGSVDVIDLHPGDDNNSEQWFLLDIKCIQIPLKIL